jgi:hypothetical protein
MATGTEPDWEGPPDEVGVDRHGLAVIGLMVGLSAGLTLLADEVGLQYAQGVMWPTDLVTFERVFAAPVGETGRRRAGRPDLVVVGSSRVALDLIPGVIERCLDESTPGEPAEVFVLGRTFATLPTMRRMVEDVLVGETIPHMLLVGLSPEAIDENNPRNAEGAAAGLRLTDLPQALVEAGNTREAWGALRTVARGPETWALAATGRLDVDLRLPWLMAWQGGGQWCVGSPACEQQNVDFQARSQVRWAEQTAELLPQLASERFADFSPGTGRVGEAWAGLQAWSKAHGVQLVVLGMPFSAAWEAQVPADVRAGYSAWVAAEVVAAGIPYYEDPPVKEGLGRISRTQRLWADADHLNAAGATSFSREVCRKLVLPLRAGARGAL